jgi:hypothetical protein
MIGDREQVGFTPLGIHFLPVFPEFFKGRLYQVTRILRIPGGFKHEPVQPVRVQLHTVIVIIARHIRQGLF